MKTARYAAAALTALMSLANLPAGFTASEQDLPAAAAWLATMLGVVGLVALIGLMKRLPWATGLVVVVGALNASAGVWAMLEDYDGGIIGLVLGAATAVLGLVLLRSRSDKRTWA